MYAFSFANTEGSSASEIDNSTNILHYVISEIMNLLKAVNNFLNQFNHRCLTRSYLHFCKVNQSNSCSNNYFDEQILINK